MVSLIVKAEEGAGEELARRLSGRAHISIQGVTGNQVTLKLDSDDMHVIASSSREIHEMKGVIVVYPIFSGEPFTL